MNDKNGLMTKINRNDEEKLIKMLIKKKLIQSNRNYQDDKEFLQHTVTQTFLLKKKLK